MKALFIGLAAAASLGATEPGPSVFNGTWRVDVSSLDFPAKPDVRLLKDGIYTNGVGDSRTRVKADGLFHRIAGDDYVDEIAITVLDDHGIRETDKLHGKIVYMTTYRVSADKRVLTTRSIDLTKPNGKPLKSEVIRKRIGQPDRDAHLISGSWQTVKMNIVASSYLNWTFRLQGRKFSKSSTNGIGYDAIIDGPPVPVRGDTGGMAAVTMPRTDTIVQSSSSENGVVGAVMTLVVMPDGESMKATSRNVKEGTTTSFMLYKQ